jgi:cardiolipin synthase
MDLPLGNILWGIYIALIIVVCIRIILDSSTPSKTLAYILLVILVPIAGVIFYLSVGLNYRKRKLYKKKIDIDRQSFPELDSELELFRSGTEERKESELGHFASLAKFLGSKHIFSGRNATQLLINGENKFPAVLDALKSARHHIHLEYYIYENDEVGNQIAQVLIEKARAGVEVRFIYDDFGSRNIRKSVVRELINVGAEAFPFYKINIIKLANRLNYRNHRKIIVIDGKVGFVGGINVSDKYINSENSELYWRDTHLKITGPGVFNLQYTFLTDWNFCAGQNIGFSPGYFPLEILKQDYGDHFVQVVSSGPDSDYPNILYSLIQLVSLAKKEVLITTPYFIPERSFLDGLKIASLSGVRVKLLVPKISDSRIVKLTSQSQYQDLLEAGVEIYLYKKGFVHAKTMVCDGQVSVVGTANLDVRSFDLNFDTNAIVYGKELARELKLAFQADLHESDRIEHLKWSQRKLPIRLLEKVLYLFSPLM